MDLSVHAGWPRDEGAWADAALASGNVFLTPEWARAWWEHNGHGREVVSFECDGAVLVACTSGRAPLRTLRLVGHGPADELGIAAGRARQAECVRAAGRAVRDVDGCDVFVGDQLAGDADWPQAVRARVIAHVPSPTIELPGTWDEYLATRTSHFRAQLRRVRRQTADAKAVIRRTKDADALDTDLDAFFALHRRRHGSTTFSSPAGEAFHRDFARAAFARGWLGLWLLEVDGRAIAGIYTLRFGGAVSMYQSAAVADGLRSAGTALLAHVVQHAADAGMREYRFLRGGEAYKFRWATHDRGLQTVAAGLSPGGRALAALAGGVLAPRRTAVVRRNAGRAVRRALLA